MAKGLVEQSTMTAIADAIRAKNNSEDTYTPAQMADAISAITSGGGGSFIPAVLETQEELFKLYGYAKKHTYNYSSTTDSYFTFTFAEETDREYRLGFILYTYSGGGATQALVYFNDATTADFTCRNSSANKDQYFYCAVPVGTKTIKIVTNLPQYQSSDISIYLLDDLETEYTQGSDFLANSVILSPGEVVLSWHNGHTASVSMSIGKPIVQKPGNTLVSEGGITLDDGTVIKDFRGVITNASD